MRAPSLSSISIPRSETLPTSRLDLQLDDPADVGLREPVEDHRVVDPVEELGLEGRRQHLFDLLADRLVDLIAHDPVAPHVGGHDQDRVGEV